MKKSFISLLFACISVIILSGFIFSDNWDVSPTSGYVANVPFGEYEDAQFTLTAGEPWYHEGGGTVSITGQDADKFSCISGCSYYLEPEEEHKVTIRFTAPDCAPPYGPTNYGATIEFPTYSTNVIYAGIGASVSGPDPCDDD